MKQKNYREKKIDAKRFKYVTDAEVLFVIDGNNIKDIYSFIELHINYLTDEQLTKLIKNLSTKYILKLAKSYRKLLKQVHLIDMADVMSNSSDENEISNFLVVCRKLPKEKIIMLTKLKDSIKNDAHVYGDAHIYEDAYVYSNVTDAEVLFAVESNNIEDIYSFIELHINYLTDEQLTKLIKNLSTKYVVKLAKSYGKMLKQVHLIDMADVMTNSCSDNDIHNFLVSCRRLPQNKVIELRNLKDLISKEKYNLYLMPIFYNNSNTNLINTELSLNITERTNDGVYLNDNKSVFIPYFGNWIELDKVKNCIVENFGKGRITVIQIMDKKYIKDMFLFSMTYSATAKSDGIMPSFLFQKNSRTKKDYYKIIIDTDYVKYAYFDSTNLLLRLIFTDDKMITLERTPSKQYLNLCNEVIDLNYYKPNMIPEAKILVCLDRLYYFFNEFISSFQHDYIRVLEHNEYVSLTTKDIVEKLSYLITELENTEPDIIYTEIDNDENIYCQIADICNAIGNYTFIVSDNVEKTEDEINTEIKDICTKVISLIRNDSFKNFMTKNPEQRLVQLPPLVWKRRVTRELDMLKDFNRVTVTEVKETDTEYEIYLTLHAAGLNHKHEIVTEHFLHWTVSRQYPYQGVICVWISDIFHPNVYETKHACLQTVNAFDLKELAIILVNFLTAPNYQSPANSSASDFYRKNNELLLKVKRVDQKISKKLKK